MEGENKKIEVLVADTTAFIQNAPLQNFAVKVVTVAEVVNEIKCKRQLNRLVVLPYELEIKDVFPENLKAVKDFSIKTGDYRSLSLTDLKVMALTYQLELEKVGADHIRREPVQQLPTVVTKKPDMEQLPGFYVPKNGEKQNGEDRKACQDQEEGKDEHVEEETHEEERHEEENQEDDKDDEEESQEDDEDDEEKIKQMVEQIGDLNCDDILVSTKDEECSKNNDGEEEDDDEEDEDEDDSDGGGWITPSNINKVKTRMAMGASEHEEKHVKVACMTTDYAMQNVLKQMNLNVAALDGRIIKHLRIFVFRCYACFKITRNMTLRFCPKCGNQTLKKVGTSLGDDGKLIVHINAKKPLSAKGKRFLGSMPKIKGGKHPNNVIIVADQPMPDDKPSRMAKTKTNVFADGYLGSLEGFSPFATRDTGSRSAMLNFQGRKGVTNPTGNRRRKK